MEPPKASPCSLKASSSSVGHSCDQTSGPPPQCAAFVCSQCCKPIAEGSGLFMMCDQPYCSDECRARAFFGDIDNPQDLPEFMRNRQAPLSPRSKRKLGDSRGYDSSDSDNSFHIADQVV